MFSSCASPDIEYTRNNAGVFQWFQREPGSAAEIARTIFSAIFAIFVSRWPLQRNVRCPLLSEIFADDFAIELFPMWPFEQQPELGFKPFTNRWQLGHHNRLASCECCVDGPQDRPVQRRHQDFVRAARPLRSDRMLE